MTHAEELRDGLAWMRASNSRHLRLAGTCWSAALGAIARIHEANDEERRILANDVGSLFAEGSDAWAAYLERELRRMTCAPDEPRPELHRLARWVRSFRRALQGDALAREMLHAQIESLANMLSAAEMRTGT